MGAQVGKLHGYDGAGIRITYDAGRCIHAAECVRGLPTVFDTARRPWIDADGASPDEVAAVIRKCPTGALQFERLDGGEPEVPAARNEITVAPDGTLKIDALGFKGPDCEQATRFLEEALGQVSDRQHKPEYISRHTVARRQRVGR